MPDTLRSIIKISLITLFICGKPTILNFSMAAFAASATDIQNNSDSTTVNAPETIEMQLEQLGQQLFFDTRFSLNKTQSCATCHDPSMGFSDHRGSPEPSDTSLGDDGQSFGTRNTPTASYARFSPPFHLTKDGKYVGGQFLDGRSATLADQAIKPPFNPLEMNLPDNREMFNRIRENPSYIDAFETLFNKDVLEDPDAAVKAFGQAIASFEETDYFSPFDSKYDRYLKGEYQLSEQEDLGMTLFFSDQFTNCATCHQLQPIPGSTNETFSNYEFHNIGTPANSRLAVKFEGQSMEADVGLLSRPDIIDENQAGKFKVPTLRNVAVTGPYMHNGVFKDLRTVILFYNKYNSRNKQRQINPETGQHWANPELNSNLSRKELESGPALDDKRIDALVAFLKTLTDKRFEHLVQ